MDLTATIDAYCERLGPGLWAEPVNAVTNLAFVLVAAWLWPRVAGLPLARVLCVVLAAIGVGSGLFHTLATGWAALADVVPIAVFVLIYVFAVNRDVWGWPLWGAALGVVAFLPYAAVTGWVFAQLPFFGISAVYWPVPLLILAYAFALRGRAPATARGLAIGAGILCLSLTARSLDDTLCPALPLGTHFMWHLLNAVMLGWMIAVYRAHMLAGRGARG